MFNFSVSPSFQTSTVVFNILTDDYGQETTWELKDSSGVLVESGPATDYNNATNYQETITIPNLDECYAFTIFDSANDGICCGWGIGDYNLEDASGNVIDDDRLIFVQHNFKYLKSNITNQYVTNNG